MAATSCFIACRAPSLRPWTSCGQLSSLRRGTATSAFRPSASLLQEHHNVDGLNTLQPVVSFRGVSRSLIAKQASYLQSGLSQRPACFTVARYASSLAADPHDEEIPTSPPFSAGSYSTLTVGVPRESYPGERRVAITPQNVKLLLKKGFSRILIERGAGVEAQFTDEAYEQAGAKTVDRRTIFSESDIVLKVRAPSVDGPDSEVDALREGATVISFLYPVQNRPVVDRLSSRKVTAFAMDMVPRISRAQVFDALRYNDSYCLLLARD